MSKKLCILHDSNYVALWERQNYGGSKQMSGCEGLGSGASVRSTEAVQGLETLKLGQGCWSLLISLNPENVQHEE